MDLGLAGKRVLVTGAGRGLGRVLARALAEEGALVAVNDRNAAALVAVLADLGPAGVAAPADLATFDGPARCFAQALAGLGGLDILINNAAVNLENPIEATTLALWDLHLAVDLRAPHLLVVAALPALLSSHGVVLNIASELGLHAVPNNVAYIAAKHGLIALTRALAVELGPAGVRVNALCPGAMDTELMTESAEASGDPAAYYAQLQHYNPQGRMASPQEVARFALTLVSPASAFMTGAAIAFDGGSTAGREWGRA